MTDLVERLRLMGLANPPLREAADEIERFAARVAELEDISNIRIKAFEDARNAIEETGIGITSPIAWRKADDALCALIMREGK